MEQEYRRYFTPGQNLKIFYPGSAQFCFATVEIEDYDYVLVDIRHNYAENAVEMNVGQVLNVQLNVEMELLSCKVRFIKYVEGDDDVERWMISKPFDFYRVQRRNFYRLDIEIPMQLYLYDEKTKEYNFYEDIPCTTVNLSIGGIGFITFDERIAKMRNIHVSFVLEKNRISEFATVRNCTPKTIRGKEGYFVGAQFLGLDYKVQNNISYFINKKTIEYIRNRNLKYAAARYN